MLKYIKYHWFGLTLSLVVALFMLQFLLVLIAPHHDVQQRGFASCTQQLSQDAETCKSSALCVLKAVINNTFCDTKIILSGLSEWMSGRQERPWSNYLFVPEMPESEEPDEELEEFYLNNPNLLEQMEELKQKHKELEKMNNEQKYTSGMEPERSVSEH